MFCNILTCVIWQNKRSCINATDVVDVKVKLKIFVTEVESVGINRCEVIIGQVDEV